MAQRKTNQSQGNGLGISMKNEEFRKDIEKTTVIYTKCDRYQGIDGYGWWEVPTAEVSEMKIVDEAHKNNLEQKKKQRFHN